jgi:hypothetical protein
MKGNGPHSVVIEVPRVKLVELRNELGSNTRHAFTLEVKNTRGLTSRPPLGQVELLDVIIHASAAVALQEIVNYIKARISYAKIKDGKLDDKES